jgi:hypothetical protein
LPLQFEDIVASAGRGDRDFIGISDAEIVELASSYRQFGYFRIALDTGHLYLSEDACAIFAIPYVTTPVSLSLLSHRIHPGDADILFGGIEELATKRCGGHYVFRVLAAGGGYQGLRLVARVRDDPVGGGGDLVGIVYVLFDKLPCAGMLKTE